MQRRQHAEELLEWKRRLDAEEAEIQQMEKQALAAWDKELAKPKTPKKELESQRTAQRGNDCKREPNILFTYFWKGMVKSEGGSSATHLVHTTFKKLSNFLPM